MWVLRRVFGVFVGGGMEGEEMGESGERIRGGEFGDYGEVLRECEMKRGVGFFNI